MVPETTAGGKKAAESGFPRHLLPGTPPRGASYDAETFCPGTALPLKMRACGTSSPEGTAEKVFTILEAV